MQPFRHMFFSSWADIGRVIVVSAVTFVLAVVVLRFAGQQALARMFGYCVVVTVTLGSIIATVVVTRDLTVSEGVAALVMLVALSENDGDWSVISNSGAPSDESAFYGLLIPG